MLYEKKIQEKNKKCQELINEADNLELDNEIIEVYKEFLKIFNKETTVKNNRVECPVLIFENMSYIYLIKLVYENNNISLVISLTSKCDDKKSKKCLNPNDIVEVSFDDCNDIAEILYSVCYQKSSTRNIARVISFGFDQRKLFN